MMLIQKIVQILYSKYVILVGQHFMKIIKEKQCVEQENNYVLKY